MYALMFMLTKDASTLHDKRTDQMTYQGGSGRGAGWSMRMSWRGAFDGMTRRERWKRGTATCSCGVQSGKRLEGMDSVNGRATSEL